MFNFIGKGSAFTPNLGNTSAYFLKDNDLYLIDCGSLVFKELYNRIDFNNIRNLYVFITHTHSDHVGSLGTLISYLKINYEISPNIFHGGVYIEEYLNLVGVSADYYEAKAVDILEKNNITFEFIETIHSDRISSYGLLIKTIENIVFYSGDSAEIPEDILTSFIDRKIDFIYQDVSLEIKNTSHLNLEKLKKLIPKKLRNRVIAMHLDEGADEIISEAGFQIAKVNNK